MLFEEPLVHALLLGAAPISEVRGAVIYAFGINQPWLILPAALANILVGVALMAFWDLFGIEAWGRKILGVGLKKKLDEGAAKYEKYGFLGLALFIGIPLPLTGVYTGVLVGKILGLRKRVIFAACVLGVALATLVSVAVVGGFAALF
ncbi:MAG: small multi-drug export protein [Candidatus Micrarchaeia archaeon]